MHEAILIVLCIVGLIIAFYCLYSLPGDFLKEFEKSCCESIEKRNKELEDKEKLYKELRKHLF